MTSFKTATKFASLNLHANTQRAIREVFKYDLCSNVQEAAIPIALQGFDVLTKAKTGSGKTLAFLIPAINRLTQQQQPARGAISCLVTSPTRELAQQIADEANKLLTFHTGFNCVSVVGGTNINTDIKRLSKGATILVATPGRLLDLLQNTPSVADGIKNLKVLVYDEADRLLDQGFRPDLVKILSYLPDYNSRQTLMFSATVSQDIKQIAAMALRKDHKFVDCVQADDVNSNAAVEQFFTTVELDYQISFLYELLQRIMLERPNDFKVQVFFTTTRVTGFMSELFNIAGIPVLELHSRKSQSARQKVTDEFRTQPKRILFTSDVSARGIDTLDVSHVIQLGLPSDAEQYVHRIGRSGRAGKSGEALIILSPSEQPYLQKIRDQPIKPFNPPADSRLTELANRRGSAANQFDLKTVSFNANAAVQIDPAMSPKLRAALERVKLDGELTQSAQQAYSSWIGFYNSHCKLLNWNKQQLVQVANFYSSLLGLKEVPELSRKAIGMIGIKGLAGVRAESTDSFHARKQGGGGGGGRGQNQNSARGQSQGQSRPQSQGQGQGQRQGQSQGQAQGQGRSQGQGQRQGQGQVRRQSQSQGSQSNDNGGQGQSQQQHQRKKQRN